MKMSGAFPGGWILLVLPTLVSLVGCDAWSFEPPVATRLDSAGITIVESVGPAWRDGEAWVVEPDPLVQIGGLDAPDELQLYDVRGALRMADGSLVVGDGSTSRLRFLDAEGRPVRAVGRNGEGPREFGYIYYVLPFGADSLLVWDTRNARYAVYDDEGNFGRTFTLRDGGEEGTMFPGPHPVVLPDRTLLGMAQLPMRSQDPGLWRPEVAFHRFAADGRRLGRFARLPFRTFSLQRSGDDMMAMTPAAFGQETHMAPGAGSILVARGDGFTVERYSPTGELEAVFRDASWEPVPVEEHHLRDLVEARIEATREMAGRMGSSAAWVEMQTRNVSSLEAPPHFPPYAGLMADAAGDVWVRDYALPGETTNRWAVFAPDGTLLGRVAMPEGFTPTQIGPDWILGVWEDDMEVEHIRLYRLSKPAAAG